MRLLNWLSSHRGTQVVRSWLPTRIRFFPEHVLSFQGMRRVPALAWLAGLVLSLSLASGQAWGHTTAQKEEKGTIVAAGFGYQIGDISTLTVKVYDAASGEVLSEAIYELNVKEERDSGSNSSRDRIFAGGVGPEAADLSNFVLRVYDAATGKFQWEGQLNLTPPEEAGTGRMMSTVAPRRATVAKVHVDEPAMRQPIFSLRALDISTGGIVWEDEFSTDSLGTTRTQRIAALLISLDENSPEGFHTFDFRIRMFDFDGRALLWEDQVSPRESEEDTREAVDDQARVLPAWPWQLLQETAAKAI